MRNCVTWKKWYSQSVYVTGRNRVRYNLPSTKDIEDETMHFWKSTGLDINCEWQVRDYDTIDIVSYPDIAASRRHVIMSPCYHVGVNHSTHPALFRKPRTRRTLKVHDREDHPSPSRLRLNETVKFASIFVLSRIRVSSTGNRYRMRTKSWSRRVGPVADERSHVDRIFVLEMLHLSGFTTHLAGWFLLRAAPSQIDHPTTLTSIQTRSIENQVLLKLYSYLNTKKNETTSLYSMHDFRIYVSWDTSLQIYFLQVQRKHYMLDISSSNHGECFIYDNSDTNEMVIIPRQAIPSSGEGVVHCGNIKCRPGEQAFIVEAKHFPSGRLLSRHYVPHTWLISY